MRLLLLGVFLGAILALSGCGWLRAVSTSPQAGVDYFDWARERNERGCYAQVVDNFEKYGAPYCTVDVDSFDYPVFFGELGLADSVYNYPTNAIRYPLGDHEKMSHEIGHSIIARGAVSQACVEQLASQYVSQPFEFSIQSTERR